MKKMCVFLLALILTVLPAASLALEMTELPATWQELCDMLPPMPEVEPGSVQLLFPSYDSVIDDSSAFTIYCDNNQWKSAIAIVYIYNVGFNYDESIGAFVSQPERAKDIALVGKCGLVTGGIAIDGGTDENGWLSQLEIYFDEEASIQIMSEISWPEDSEVNLNFASNENPGYIMPVVISTLELDNGTLVINRFADKTSVLLRGKNKEVIAEATYPEYSEYSAQFMPLFAPLAAE